MQENREKKNEKLGQANRKIAKLPLPPPLHPRTLPRHQLLRPGTVGIR